MTLPEGHSEAVPLGVAIWQSDRAKTYRCPVCLINIFSQYEGDDLPEVICHSPEGWHQLIWDALSTSPEGAKP